MSERLPEPGERVVLRFVGKVWEVSSMRRYLGTVQTVKSVDRKYGSFDIEGDSFGWRWRAVNIETYIDDLVSPPDDTELSGFIGF